MAGVLVGVVGLALGFFLHREGIIRAGAWAGIIGLSGIPIGVLGVWLAWPRTRDGGDLPEQGSSVRIQQNNPSGHGTTFAVQDGNQIIYGDKPTDGTAGALKRKHSGDDE
jgi:hypothetical protein